MRHSFAFACAFTVALLFAGCAHAPVVASVATANGELRVSATLVEVHDEKPPKARYVFDLVIDSPGDEPRWLLVPRALDRSGLPRTGGVTGVEPTARDGEGRVILGEFLGTGGFVAIKLPPRAHLIVRRFAIASYTLPAQPIALELVSARTVTVGDEAIEEWFPSGPTSDAQAIVDDSQAKRLAARHSPEHRELPVIADDAKRFVVTARSAR